MTVINCSRIKGHQTFLTRKVMSDCCLPASTFSGRACQRDRQESELMPNAAKVCRNICSD